MLNEKQIEKFNCMIGALICHGKDYNDKTYVYNDIVVYRIEEFLYSIDKDFRKYLDVDNLYKQDEKKHQKSGRYFVPDYNKYNSNIEVKFVSDVSKCLQCACGSCPAAYDPCCPNNENGKCKNCDKCIDGRHTSNIKNTDMFKTECDKKIDAIESWVAEITSPE